MKNDNHTENVIARVNNSTFLREFTYSETQFHVGEKRDSKELADNIVWLDDIVFLFQLKERDANQEINDIRLDKWYTKKVRKKAVSQIKDTISFLTTIKYLPIQNDYGHIVDLSKIDPNQAKKIIIYNPNSELPEERRYVKFHESRTSGLIHLFHIEDYIELVKILITPAEINEYLSFREELFQYCRGYMDIYPEQLVLGHFLGEDDLDKFGPEQIENLHKLNENKSDFDFISILSDFSDRQVTINDNEETSYYYIIKEIAKLKRRELSNFKERFLWAFQSCTSKRFDLPSRIMFPRTEIGFIFIPVNREVRMHWEIALLNFTNLHLYDQKLNKCIGVAFFESVDNKGMVDIMWSLIERQWEYDSVLDKVLKEKKPLTKVKIVEFERYNLNKSNGS